MKSENKIQIEGMKLIDAFTFFDERGAIVKEYAHNNLKSKGIDFTVCEVLHIFSKKGVIRGLHIQQKKPQSRLLYCLYGEIYAGVVDLRRDSSTFKKSELVGLSSSNRKILFLPAGCALGTMAVKNSMFVCYCDGDFFPEFGAGILWNDPYVGIDWPLNLIHGEAKISKKDKRLPCLREYLVARGETCL